MDVTTHRLLRTLPVDFAVRYAQRSSSGLSEPRQRNGRLLARCQLPARDVPENTCMQSAISHMKEKRSSRAAPAMVIFKRVEGMCWPTTGAAHGRRGTNKPRFSWASGPVAHRAGACLRIGAERAVYTHTTHFGTL